MSKQKLNTTYKDSEFYFDDCSICKAVSEAEENGHSLSAEELHEVFEQANTKESTIFGRKNN